MLSFQRCRYIAILTAISNFLTYSSLSQQIDSLLNDCDSIKFDRNDVSEQYRSSKSFLKRPLSSDGIYDTADCRKKASHESQLNPGVLHYRSVGEEDWFVEDGEQRIDDENAKARSITIHGITGTVLYEDSELAVISTKF